MSYFRGIRETVESQVVIKDIDFLQIDMSSVAVGVAKQAELWKNDYGEVLLTTSNSLLTKLQDRITLLEQHVASETTGIEELKFVLNVIGEIATLMQDVELEMVDITERYRTLDRHKIVVPAEEMLAAMNIEARWRKLYVDSRTRDLRLIDTKMQFREETRVSDIEFREVLVQLRKNFLDAGPGVSTTNLDDGVELLADYKRQLSKMNKVKAELINAQNLFNLDVKPYPDLQQTMVDIEKLSKIYDLYTMFKDFQVNMSSMLWGDLDISVLQKGADDIEKTAKKFPKELKEIFTFKRPCPWWSTSRTTR